MLLQMLPVDDVLQVLFAVRTYINLGFRRVVVADVFEDEVEGDGEVFEEFVLGGSFDNLGSLVEAAAS